MKNPKIKVIMIVVLIVAIIGGIFSIRHSNDSGNMNFLKSEEEKIKEKNIDNLFESIDNIYKIKTTGDPLLLTGDHLIYVITNTNAGKPYRRFSEPYWKKASELIPDNEKKNLKIQMKEASPDDFMDEVFRSSGPTSEHHLFK